MLYFILIIGSLISLPDTTRYYWVETTQEDFKDGAFEHNLYASHRGDGAVEFVPRFDLNNDGYIDLFVAGHPDTNNYIYWGDITGYSIDRRTSYYGNCGGNCDAADLNCDGYSDFLSTCYHSAYIALFWGTEGGPDYNNSIILNMAGIWNETSIIADFNKDGYLDIAVGCYDSSYAAVFWGSSSGYSSSNVETFRVPSFTAFNLVVADFNKDKWLDLLIVNVTGSSDYIYWGSEEGFSVNNRTELHFLSSEPHGACTADLNNDGWLDLILTGHNYINEAYIYWGSEFGFQTHQVLDLNRSTFGGSSINDFDSDGYLDILFLIGDGYNQNYSQKSRIYWGSANGYSYGNRTDIGIRLNASGGLVADFNYDNYLDVYICNFGGDSSYVFWGPRFNTYQVIQHFGAVNHHAMAREVGNTYNRQYYEDYQSSIFDAGWATDWHNVYWDGFLPPGTEIKMFLRSGNTLNPDSTWLSWIEMINGESIPDILNAHYLQYMAKLIYTNPSYLPILYSVRFDITPQISQIVDGPKRNPEIPPTCARIGEPKLQNPETIPTIARIDLLGTTDRIQILIYNSMGRLTGKLSDITKIPLYQTLTFTITDILGKKLPVGVYFYRLPTTDGLFETKKFVVLK
jgi:FG-GAP-like repeat